MTTDHEPHSGLLNYISEMGVKARQEADQRDHLRRLLQDGIGAARKAVQTAAATRTLEAVAMAAGANTGLSNAAQYLTASASPATLESAIAVVAEYRRAAERMVAVQPVTSGSRRRLDLG